MAGEHEEQEYDEFEGDEIPDEAEDMEGTGAMAGNDYFDEDSNSKSNPGSKVQQITQTCFSMKRVYIVLFSGLCSGLGVHEEQA